MSLYCVILTIYFVPIAEFRLIFLSLSLSLTNLGVCLFWFGLPKEKKKKFTCNQTIKSMCCVFFYYYRLIAHLKCQLNTTKAACSVSLPFLIPTKIFRFYFRSMELCLHLEQFVRDNFVKSKRKITTTIKNKKK